MFDCFKPHASKNDTGKQDRRAADEAATIVEIDALALAAEIDALGQRASVLAAATAEHLQDCLHYTFECHRWGDFLNVCIRRRVNEPWRNQRELGGYRLASYATSVNWRATTELRLLEGHGPDSNGELTYSVCLKSDNGSSSGWGTGYGRFPAPLGHHYKVWASIPSTMPCRKLFTLDPKKRDRDRDYGGYDNSSYRPERRTPNYPRLAEDDHIRFEGIGATIFVPAGLGTNVHQTILKELATPETAEKET